MRKSTSIIAASLVTLGLVASGCSTKGGNSQQQSTDDSGVKTDYGVTDSKITLGAMTDNSGVFKVIGLDITHGNQVWADEVNADGGICGRDIEILTRDHGYAADKAVTQYAEIKDEVAGMVQMLGSPVVSALKPQVVSDNILTVPASYTSHILDSPQVLMVGATYDIEMINGLAWLQEQGMIKDGDKIGHVFVDSEYGASGREGSAFYAEQHGMNVVEIKVTASDVDMASTVTKLKGEGVSAIAMTITPKAMASISLQNVAQGLNVQLIGSSPTWDPTLLGTPAKESFANYHRATSWANFGADIPAMADLKALYEGKFTEPGSSSVTSGYAAGLAFGEILKKACDNKDLTRDGIVKASGNVKVDTKGLMGELDFSKPGTPGTRESFIMGVDLNSTDGDVIVAELKASKEALAQKLPYEK